MFRILYQGDLFADYHQLVLHDEAHDQLPDEFTEAMIDDRLVVGPHGAVVFTARDMTVPVCVEWHRAYPEPDLVAFEHVVEAGFACPTGRLVIAGLMDRGTDAARLAVPPGGIGLQACFSGLDTLDETGLEGDDRYLLRLWQAPATTAGPAAAVRVPKRWPPC